ncbi:MAG: hypothetical protein JW856_04435 [Dehalococcoidales bacterium]|nr:hypothetical protein [Dehalococcoidales bacterium]
MEIKWQNLNKPTGSNNELSNEPGNEQLLRIIRLLQKAGFCCYPVDEERDNQTFVMTPALSQSESPQGLHNRN